MPQQYCAQTVPMAEALVLVNTGDGTKTVTIIRDIPLPWQTAALETVSAAGQTQCVVLPGNSHTIDAYQHTWLIVVYVGCAGQPTQVALIDQKDQRDLDTLLAAAAISTTGWAILGKIIAAEVVDYHQYSTVTPTISTSVASATSAKVLSLWNGSGNDAPPAGWETLAFDDSGWANADVAEQSALYIPNTTMIWKEPTAGANAEELLVRQHFSLPPQAVASAQLQTAIDASLIDCFINGTHVLSHTQSLTLAIPPASDSIYISPDLLNTGGSDNVIAIHAQNDQISGDVGGNVDFLCTVQSIVI